MTVVTQSIANLRFSRIIMFCLFDPVIAGVEKTSVGKIKSVPFSAKDLCREQTIIRLQF